MALCGISFAGADVPGFFGDPDRDLYVRWHQLGIWYPFYRAHAHLTTKRREPWLMGAEVTDLVREAVFARYRLLPHWYTLFFEWASRGSPVIRPLWFNSLADAKLDPHTDDHFLVGSSILVRAITAPKQKNVEVRLPAGKWYDYWDTTVVPKNGEQTVKLQVHPSRVPVFVREGQIL